MILMQRQCKGVLSLAGSQACDSAQYIHVVAEHSLMLFFFFIFNFFIGSNGKMYAPLQAAKLLSHKDSRPGTVAAQI